MLARLLAENSMLRHRAQQSSVAAAGAGYWPPATAHSAAWAASGGTAGAPWPHVRVAASDRILAASAATKLYALGSQMPTASLAANPGGAPPPSAAALHAAYAAFSGALNPALSTR
jgi:hypothetical protein